MKFYAPTTPGRRKASGVDYSGLTGKKPLKKLTAGLRARGGRARSGRITTRFRGGGNKRTYRFVDFYQLDKRNIAARVEAIEYDPNRSAFIARIVYRDGERRYILAPHGLKDGDTVMTSEQAALSPGNRLPLAKIPPGIEIHNIALTPHGEGKIVRSAGNAAKILSQEGAFANIVLPSSEVRRIPSGAYASVGVVSNAEHGMVRKGKAGRVRWKGKRPHVRGAAMNPRDHPHGGGEGRAPIGMKYPKTKWGKHAMGVKTRKRNKLSNKYIVQRRKKN